MKDTVNYFAIIVSAVSAYVLSSVWYLVLFRAPYMEALGKTKEQMDKGPSMLSASIIQFIGNLIMAYGLVWLMNRLGYDGSVKGMQLGLIIWIAFVAAVFGPMYAFEASSFKLLLINTGSVLISLLAMGAILGGWR